MATSNEKADVIIPQQMRKFKEEEYHHVTVVSDDTDVLVLLLDYYWKEGWKEGVVPSQCAVSCSFDDTFR